MVTSLVSYLSGQTV